MRSVADFRLANLVTGFTPGRLFQISTRRLLSGPIRSANCSSAGKGAQASLACCLAGGVDGDVVLGIDSERLHVSALFPVAYSRTNIHHSGRGHKQADSAGNRKAHGKALAAASPGVRR